MAKTKEYQRLAGYYRNFFTAENFRLWLAKDHLLQIKNQRYSETYKRFYFKDIQAIALTKTPKGRSMNIVFAVLSCIIALPCVFYDKSSPLVAVGFFFSAIFLFSLLVNTILGPTCTCRLQTAVQIEELKSLNRLRRSKKVVRLLRAKVEEVQGSLVFEQTQPVV